MAQLMPLPLTVSCFSKIQIGFTFLVPAHPGSPGQRAVKRVCVCGLMVNNDNTHLTAFSQDNLGKPIHQKGKAVLDSNDARDNGVLGMAVALAGPYANNLYQTANCVNISSFSFRMVG